MKLQQPEMSLSAFAKHYLGPKQFSKLKFNQKRTPYLFLTLFFVGFSFFHAYSLAGQLRQMEQGQLAALNIQMTWILAALLGVLVGLALYFIVGSLFYGLMRLSGGKKDWRTSANIYLYAYLPLALFYLVLRAINDLTGVNLGIVWSIVRFLAIVYFFTLLFMAARKQMEVKKGRGILFLIILPLLFLLVLALGKVISA